MSTRSGAAREPPQQLQLLPDDIEKENAAILNKLPPGVWQEIVSWLDGTSMFPFAMTCRYFRKLQKDEDEREQERISRATTPHYNPHLSTPHTTLTTTLKSCSYIETTDYGDMIFPPSILWIFNVFFFVSADYMKWLFGETRSTYCQETALAARPRWDGKPRYVAAQGEQNLMEMAAAKGDLDLIKWLRSQDPPCEWSKKACSAAAWGNHWDLLRQLLSMDCPIEKEGVFGMVACDPGHLPDTDWKEKFEILKWLDREHGCEFGNSDTMDWYEGYHHIKEVVKASIEHDDLECLEWVVEEQCIPWEHVVYGPNENEFEGHGPVGLDLLREDVEIYINVDVCRVAAKMGRLKILRYAVEDGCPWIPAMCLEAAEENKHEDVMKWIADRARLASSDSHDSDSESDPLSE